METALKLYSESLTVDRAGLAQDPDVRVGNLIVWPASFAGECAGRIRKPGCDQPVVVSLLGIDVIQLVRMVTPAARVTEAQYHSLLNDLFDGSIPLVDLHARQVAHG